ncbi:MAG: Asd/ArgC dimerization domain-containing protein [Bryobacterales bacterium]|nr:Asd/ArgC dimerization domain-containing protein [Bryobacterales bacterium]
MADPKRQAMVVLVGGETLAGREVRDVLHRSGLPVRVQWTGAEDPSAVTLTARDGEPVVVSALDEENLTGAAVVILAGSAASSRTAFGLLKRRSPRPAVIDLTEGLEDLPEARLRAPMLEPEGYVVDRDAVHTVAHPAAIAMAVLLRRIAARRAVIQVLAPVSEQGRRGVGELRQQVVNLFSFKPLPKEVFDEQIGFNLLARYGAEAPESLAGAEGRIDRHLATLLALGAPVAMPSWRLVQAPVFHGYCFSVWLEFERRTGAREIAAALACAQIDVRTDGQEAPTNVGVAGQSGITVGAIENDRNSSQAVWLWAAVDNLRLTADNAVAVAGQLLGAGVP